MSEPRKIEKTRTLDEVYSKANSLMSAAYRAGNMDRYNRIKGIRDRYVSNIKSTKEYEFDAKKQNDRAQEAIDAARKKGYTTAARANRDKRLTKMYGTYGNDFFNQRLGSVVMPGLWQRAYSRSVYAKTNR